MDDPILSWVSVGRGEGGASGTRIENRVAGSEVARKLERTVREALLIIPDHLRRDLAVVVLRQTSDISKKESRRKARTRGGRVPIRRAQGLYRRKTRSEGARIDLFLDNIFSPWPSWWPRVRPLRDLTVAVVLFHEVGHYLSDSLVQGRYQRDREDEADFWKRKLSKIYLRRRYRYMVPVMFVARHVVNLLIFVQDAIQARREGSLDDDGSTRGA